MDYMLLLLGRIRLGFELYLLLQGVLDLMRFLCKLLKHLDQPMQPYLLFPMLLFFGFREMYGIRQSSA